MHRYIPASVKQVLGGLAAIAILACALPATALAQSAIKVDKQAAALVPEDIRQRGVITVAMDATYAPFEYLSPTTGKIVGYDVDVSNALAAVLGLKAKQLNVRFTSIITSLDAHKYDMSMSAFSITKAREKVVDFVGPYLQSGSVLEVITGNPHGVTLNELALCGHTVGAVKGSTQGSQFLPAMSKQCVASGKAPITINNYATQNEANLALNSKRAEAVFAAFGTIAYQVSLSHDRFQIAPGPQYETTPVGIAMPKNSPLEPAIKAALKVIKEDGVLEGLQKKWFGA